MAIPENVRKIFGEHGISDADMRLMVDMSHNIEVEIVALIKRKIEIVPDEVQRILLMSVLIRVERHCNMILNSILKEGE